MPFHCEVKNFHWTTFERLESDPHLTSFKASIGTRIAMQSWTYKLTILSFIRDTKVPRNWHRAWVKGFLLILKFSGPFCLKHVRAHTIASFAFVSVNEKWKMDTDNFFGNIKGTAGKFLHKVERECWKIVNSWVNFQFWLNARSDARQTEFDISCTKMVLRQNAPFLAREPQLWHGCVLTEHRPVR